jgi:NAD kinase
MERGSDRKIILVTRRTRLEELLARFNSASQAKFYVEHLGGDFRDYQSEHEEYAAAAAETRLVLSRHGRLQSLDRAYLPNFLFGRNDLVISLGQDGLVANTLKYLDGNPLMGVNPSPSRWDGVLLPFKVRDLEKAVPEAVRDSRPRKQVSMAEARLNDGQSLLAVNDLFIGQKSHVSARYRIEFEGRQEAHSSSGIIVSTGLGSTGWLKSVMVGAAKLASGEPNRKKEAGETSRKKEASLATDGFPWDADFLRFSVREPFPSRTTGTDLVSGRVTRKSSLAIQSMMAENGVLFSDGVEADFLEFNSGKTATITLSERMGVLVQ